MAASSVPKSTIRAWQYTTTKGGLEKNLKLNNSATLPKPTSNQHLVQIIASSINPVDYKPAEVGFISSLMIKKPATPGVDFVGRIVAPASGSKLKRDQIIFGMAGSSPFAAGAFSEYAAVPESQATVLPDGVDVIGAGGVGVAGLTGYQSILSHVKAGDKVFINGGSGGTGVFGIQLAKAFGCYVTTTCSTPNVELCKSLGADEVIDYRKEDVIDALKISSRNKKFDHVVDNVCSTTSLYYKAHEYTNPNAKFILVAGSPTFKYLLDTLKMRLWPGFLGGGKRLVMGFFAKGSIADLDQIGKWMQEGKVKTIIDERIPFERAPEAFTKSKTGRTKGKVIVEVDTQAAHGSKQS